MRARRLTRIFSTAGGLALATLSLACGDGSPAEPLPPDGPPKAMAPACTDCAAAKFPDLLTYFERSISRTCTPNFGVCHNSRQAPDMTTLSHFVAAIGQRCNQLRDDPTAIDNLCEPPGDSIQLTDGSRTFSSPIGYVSVLPPGSTMATATQLVLRLKHPPAERFPASATAQLVRTDPAMALPPLRLTLPSGVIQVSVEAGTAELVLSASLLRASRLATTTTTLFQFFSPEKYQPGAAQQVVLADPNRDGVYGADLGGLQIRPGDPQRSYLLVRMVAPLPAPDARTNQAPKAPLLESQMPLANFDYWDIENATYAMYCWIKGLRRTPDGATNALGPIDYAGCGELPADLKPQPQGGEARTWSAIWARIIKPSCATAMCHDSQTRAGKLDLSDAQRAHVALWNQRSTQSTDPGIKLVYPFNPEQSYLVQKLRGTAAAPYETRMPLGRELPDRDASIAAIVTWINQGARDN